MSVLRSCRVLAKPPIMTSIFIFHELPPKVRLTVFREFARILKRGGRFVLVIHSR